MEAETKLQSEFGAELRKQLIGTLSHEFMRVGQGIAAILRATDQVVSYVMKAKDPKARLSAVEAVLIHGLQAGRSVEAIIGDAKLIEHYIEHGEIL